MSNITFINVAGFFGSGSSAVVDLLKEFKDFYECDAEIRFVKDPGGISQMENALVNQWELVNSAAAIADFRDLCKMGCRPGGKNPFAKAGLAYSKRITPDFMDIVDQYIDKLSIYKYQGDFYHFKFKKPFIQYAVDRMRYAIELYSKGKFKTANRNMRPLCFSHPTQEEFNEATQCFFEELFRKYNKDAEHSYILLDQAVSPNNSSVIHRYFKDSKMIIVDRDPRDTFINEYRWVCYLDNDYNTEEGGHRYALRQRALRSGLIEDNDILYIRFEDLIINYEESKKKIADFLGIPLENHIYPKRFLKPEISKKNIGLWKSYYIDFKNLIDTIEKELPDLCYTL